MIQTNATNKQSPYFRMLTDDQIHELIRAAFEVMEKVGFKILHADARNILKKASQYHQSLIFLAIVFRKQRETSNSHGACSS